MKRMPPYSGKIEKLEVLNYKTHLITNHCMSIVTFIESHLWGCICDGVTTYLYWNPSLNAIFGQGTDLRFEI